MSESGSFSDFDTRTRNVRFTPDLIEATGEITRAGGSLIFFARYAHLRRAEAVCIFRDDQAGEAAGARRGSRIKWLTQEKFENYPEAERPGNAIHPLQQIDLSADGIDLSADDIDISADDIDIPAHHTEIMFDSVETAIIGGHGLGGLPRLVFRRA